MADEFLASHQTPYETAPTTFNMQELLHEIHLQPGTHLPHQPPSHLPHYRSLSSTNLPSNQEDFFEQEFELEKQNLKSIENSCRVKYMLSYIDVVVVSHSSSSGSSSSSSSSSSSGSSSSSSNDVSSSINTTWLFFQHPIGWQSTISTQSALRS